MKQLEKKLKELQKQGYEYIGIIQVLQWIAEIQRDNRLNRVRNIWYMEKLMTKNGDKKVKGKFMKKEEQSNNANMLLCAGFISVSNNLPKSENELNGIGSYYFSPKLMVIEGKRKYKATFQIAKKQFYRAGDNLGREDFGHLSPCCWKYL